MTWNNTTQAITIVRRYEKLVTMNDYGNNLILTYVVVN